MFLEELWEYQRMRQSSDKTVTISQGTAEVFKRKNIKLIQSSNLFQVFSSAITV